ncbi:hypothetical protein BsWGS_23395 [Bradybaena similaris]
MTPARGILLILTATFVSTECSRIIEDIQINNPNNDVTTCNTRLAACLPDLSDQPVLRGDSCNYGTLLPQINEICEDYANQVQCLEDLTADCPYFSSVTDDVWYRQIGYLCGDIGRTRLSENLNSPCYSDTPWPLNPPSELIWPQCLANQGGNMPLYLSYFSRISVCAVRKLQQLCDRPVSKIFKDLWLIKYRDYLPDGL